MESIEKAIDKEEDLKKGITESFRRFGVAYTYQNDDTEIVLLDPNKLTMHSPLYSITYGNGYPVVIGKKTLIFPSKPVADGALTVLQQLKPDVRYKIEPYNPNKKILIK